MLNCAWAISARILAAASKLWGPKKRSLLGLPQDSEEREGRH